MYLPFCFFICVIYIVNYDNYVVLFQPMIKNSFFLTKYYNMTYLSASKKKKST